MPGSLCRQSCDNNFCTDGCEWDTPNQEILNRLIGAISDDCTYTPSHPSGNAWKYGCNLGVSTTDLFNNSNGWNFKTYVCDERNGGRCPLSGTTLAGQARRVGADRGQITMTGDTPLAGNLVDLSRSTVTIELLLYEAAGAGAGESPCIPQGRRCTPWSSPQAGANERILPPLKLLMGAIQALASPYVFATGCYTGGSRPRA